MGFKVVLKLSENDPEGQVIWESEGDATLVDEVQVMTSRGAMGRAKFDATMDQVTLVVNVRDGVESNYGDLMELEERREKGELIQERQKNQKSPKINIPEDPNGTAAMLDPELRARLTKEQKERENPSADTEEDNVAVEPEKEAVKVGAKGKKEESKAGALDL